MKREKEETRKEEKERAEGFTEVFARAAVEFQPHFSGTFLRRHIIRERSLNENKRAEAISHSGSPADHRTGHIR